jgi:septal ring factor EnvC (AmiA/AmiB activator)
MKSIVARDLSRVGFELSQQRNGRSRLARSIVAACALAVVAGGGYYLGAVHATAADDAAGWPALLSSHERDLEQAKMMLNVSQARGHELERQIDMLNQRLSACREELTFFREARTRKR